MRVVLFCNHLTSLQLLCDLDGEKVLVGVCLPHLDGGHLAEIEVYCKLKGIPLVAYEEKKVVGFCDNLAADLAFIFAFPRVLPNSVIEQFLHGVWNFHASALPDFRGPDPLFWQIARGAHSCGLSLHQVTDEVDAGAIFSCKTVAISPMDVKGTLMSKIAQLAPQMARDIITELSVNSTIELTPQGEVEWFHRPTLDDLTIKWSSMHALEVSQLVRAANPDYSGAMTWLRGVEIRLLEVDAFEAHQEISFAPGSLLTLKGQEGLYAVCARNSYVKLNVVASSGAVTSGVRLRQLFGVEPGERFSETSTPSLEELEVG